MSVLDCVRVIIYRINKKGLEIFLVNDQSEENWKIPQGSFKDKTQPNRDYIFLERENPDGGNNEKAFAVEGDWHDIPSIRAIIKDDVRIVKDQIKQRFPELEYGAFFAVKEAFKKVLPDEYEMLKELKDIVTDRNLVKNI